MKRPTSPVPCPDDMRRVDPMRRRTLGALGALGLAASGCGGGTDTNVAGVGSGGTGAPVSVPVFASGPITGFGSVIVNGIRFDDGAAQLTDDVGRARALSQLAIGMFVEIDGVADEASGTGTAQRIRVTSEIKGPVESVDAATARLVVLGVTVQTGPATVFAGAGALASIAVGATVEVHGYADASSGVLRATLIDARASSTDEPPLKLRGTINAVDAIAGTVRVGPLTVDLRQAVIENLPSGGLVRGLPVRLEGSRDPVAGRWRVDRLTVVSRGASDGAQVRIEGAVASFESVSRFVVAGASIDASGATYTSGASATWLRDGRDVRIIGTSSGGRVVATVVQGREDDQAVGGAPDEAELKGTVVRVTRITDIAVRDAAGREFVVDATRANLRNGTVDDLKLGARIQVRGRRGSVVVASRITIET